MFRLLMLLFYLIIVFYALLRILGWIRYAFRFEARTRRIINVIVCTLFVLVCSTILLWIPFGKGRIAAAIARVGNYWLGFFIEFLPILALFDLVLLLIKCIRKKKNVGPLSLRFIRIYGICALCLSLVLTTVGVISARRIAVKNYDITVEKNAGSLDELNVVLIADTHLGYSVGCDHIRKLVDRVNAQNPDLVVLAGDVFDNNYDALDDPKELSSLFREIHSTYGVYAVYGNHDVTATLAGGFTVGGNRLRDPRMEQFLKDSGINILYDEAVTIADDSFYLIGRVDGEIPGDGRDRGERMTIEDLTAGLDYSKPVLVINHEPDELESYADNHVDVLFCGHTHGGQSFPLSLLLPLKWKLSHGSMKIGDMYAFVTSGVGVYGPNMRVFTSGEVMSIKIHFE